MNPQENNSGQQQKVETGLAIEKNERHQVDNGSGGDHVSKYFIEVAKQYPGTPHVTVSHYENSNERLSILKVDDKTVASVIETRTEFNHVEFVFAQSQSIEPMVDKVLEYISKNIQQKRVAIDEKYSRWVVDTEHLLSLKPQLLKLLKDGK